MTWGGILIQNAPLTAPTTLMRVTVQNNKQVGLACSAAVDGNGVLASGNTGGVDISPTCCITPCSPAGPLCGAGPPSEAAMAIDLAHLPCRFGPYVLVRALGGGDGERVPGRSTEAGLGRSLRRQAPDPGDAGRSGPARTRFKREAEIVRRLSHEAIAKTLAVDEFDGEPYIVQEFLEGRTLTQVLAAANGVHLRPPTAVAVHVVREVARALAYAHRLDGQGVIHRDIAPDNIMLTFSGGVRLIDFGIARRTTDPSLTVPGIVIGRHSYTAPELLRGALADSRSDIYSLGVVLWELLAGRPLWLGELGKVPAPSSVATEQIDPDLDQLALQAVATRPADRFETAEAFRQALGSFVAPGFVGEQEVSAFIRSCYDVDIERRHLAEAIAEGMALLGDDESSKDRRGPTRRRRRLVVALSATVALLAAGLAASSLRGSRLPRESPTRVASNAPTNPDRQALEPVAPRDAVPRAGQVAALAGPTAAFPPSHELSVPARVAGATPPRREAVGPATGVLLDRARDSLQMNDLAAAERQARLAIRGGSSSQKARGHAILGQVLALTGRRAEAEKEFDQAVQLDPSNEAAASALARMRRRVGVEP